jgi:flavodoxin I
MRILVVYDSMYGNTEAIAKAVAAALGADARVARAPDADPTALEGLDLLIVGAPTHGGRPMPSVQAFLDALPAVQDRRMAVFDTRSPGRIARAFGEASARAAAQLRERGAVVVGTEGFLVTGKKGPLKEGELERAVAWAKDVAGKATRHDSLD